MKFLKYLLALVLILVLLFIAKGFLTPSINYESQITVNKPAKEAWEVMSDEENLPKWIKGFKSTELVSGTENTAGAVSKIYVSEGGQDMVMTETIKAVEEYENLEMEFSMDFMNMDYQISFEEKEPGKTVITSNTTTRGNGMMAKSIVSFMTGAMKKQEDENLMSLRKIIDENTKNYFPEPVEQ